MPKTSYIPKTFKPDKLKFIQYLDSVCQEYEDAGYDMTLRQLYYVCVKEGLIPNNQEEYNRLGDLVNDARLAGLIDWNHIVDRTRNLEENAHWDKPSDAIGYMSDIYLTNRWNDQPHYVEVWIEKDALKGVLSRICRRMDVPHFSCRGYTSQSEMWGAAQRLLKKVEAGKEVHIIHLGDHDPSGIDMSRDIKDRLSLFMNPCTVHVLRAALNKFQIDKINPPPNPAKITDPRAASYIKKYGNYSWELDALTPRDLDSVIARAVKLYRDEKLWNAALERQEKGRRTLKSLKDNFSKVIEHLRGL